MEAPSTAFQPPLPGHLDFDGLRDRAIIRLQSLAGARWTDYNAHDPGLTLLEAFCYALIELGYRTTYSVPDLLAGDLGGFFSPEQALPGAPVSAADMLRYLYAESGAAHVRLDALAAGEQQPPLYFYPHGDTGAIGMDDFPGAQAISLQGLYRPSKGNWPYSAGDEETTASDQALIAALQAARGLCTDYANPVKQTPEQPAAPAAFFKTLDAEDIPLYLTLEIAPDIIGAEDFIQGLIARLAREITRMPRLHPSAQKPEDIPAEVWLELSTGKGYLAPAELERLRPRAALYASDLAQWLMDQPGVEQVRRISFPGEGITLVRLLSPEHITALNTGLTVDGLEVLQRGLPLNFNRNAVKAGVAEELALGNPASDPSLTGMGDVDYTAVSSTVFATSPIPVGEGSGMGLTGRDRKTSRYHSIRHDLPALYGMAQNDYEGLPTEQAARRKQFSAYLLFFEQILADSFAQLDYGRHLFDFRQPVPANTYAHRNLRDLPLAGAVLGPSYDILSVDSDPETRLRRLYDHLIARVGEQTYVTEPAKKLAFLQNWPELSAKRGLGIDYTDSSAPAPLEARIQALLGLENDERFYLLENILLRPLDKDRPDDEGNWLTFVPRPDPFSLRVSCVLPASGGRFAVENGETGQNFRALVCRVIREEVPAHIAIDWLWLPNDRMNAFSAAFRQYRTSLTGANTLERRVARDAILDKLIEMPESTASDTTNIPAFLIGWPAPLLDIPSIQIGFAEPFGTATIELAYSQPGAIYILCNRQGDMLRSGEEGITLEISATIHRTGTGGPLQLETPRLGNEDTTFWIKVVKIAGEAELSSFVTGNPVFIRSGYLQRKTRVRVGIRTDLETFWHPGNFRMDELMLINYESRVSVRIERVQAEVEYFLIDDAGEDLCDQGFSGSEGGNVVVVSRPLLQDTRVRIEARRSVGAQSYNKIFEQADMAGWVFVSPNPGLTVELEQAILPYGGAARLKILNTQAGVHYRLEYRDIADHEFIHDETATPGDLLVNGIRLRFSENYYWLYRISDPVAGTGGEIVLESPGLTEDTWFSVTAIKERHRPDGVFADQSVSIGTPVAVFVEPGRMPAFPLDSRTIRAGETFELPVSSPQPGVLYQLVRLDPDSQPIGPPVYLHDTDPASPRRDGIGLLELAYQNNLLPTRLGSKIGFDFVPGPPRSPDAITLVSDPLSADPSTMEVGVVATKVQSRLSIRLDGLFTLHIQHAGGRSSAGPASKKPRAPRKPRKKP